ncbi:HAMP domain-containing histidine kinase [Vannielia litorea]|uniref:sensor histidine kinase n=1 Tax=Vannielia litorea TaxID=1217970 RepID=UPI001C98C8CD|nr:HAMP domain-containing sensor histidine kinase [Vannielia litorea]MBY6154899.1 HAMP domain-containing histidine kinase [Vannielia litorea]
MSLKVLIVDDDAGDRKLLRRLITQRGCPAEISEAASGEEARVNPDLEPDLIFLDYLLPDARGVDLISPLADRWPRAAICMMTGQGDEEIATLSIQRGAVDYLPKRNISAAALDRVIENGCKLARMRWQLEEHRADLSVFSEVLVHDLKAPIRSMRFLVEKLSEDLAEGTANEVQRDVQLIGKSADRLSELVTSLASHVHLDRETVEEQITIAELVEETRLSLLAEVERTGARVRLEGNATLTCHVPQIIQLLQNLIGNAIKYAGESPPEITVRCNQSNDAIHLEVADQGIGVPLEYRKSIFEPFKRLPVAAAIPGTGLGLATCRKVVERHGGRIWCDETATQGTIIHVNFPCRPPSQSRAD